MSMTAAFAKTAVAQATGSPSTKARYVAETPGHARALPFARQRAHPLEGALDLVRPKPDPLHHRHLRHRAEEDAVALLRNPLETRGRGPIDARVLGERPNRF